MALDSSPKIDSSAEQTFLSSLNEKQKRLYFAKYSLDYPKGGVCKVIKKFHTSKTRVYKGLKELSAGSIPETYRIRRKGGGRKSELYKHPELIRVFNKVVGPYRAGLPQDEDVIWIGMDIPQIINGMRDLGHKVSSYIVRQIMNELGYRRRSFIKDLPMREVEKRDEQFNNIRKNLDMCKKVGLPILSINTKKKEIIGNFKRQGKLWCKGQPKSLDHDFASFSDGLIAPHGIYDVTHNTGFMTLGTSHDTSEFAIDHIAEVWENHLSVMYPDAHTMVLLCDGGGSNSSSSRIFKQDLIRLSDRLKMNILIMHYPPYCSKYNPIEHRLFSQITRLWSGTPLLSIKEARDRAANTTTTKGLIVHADINEKVYETKRPINPNYKKMLNKHIIFQKELPKWNYLVKTI